MYPKYKHFVITLFNLQLWTKDKKNISTRTSEWLEKRFKLFESYCFPSLKSQTVQNFIWLCLFDEQTPEPFKRKIHSFRQQFPLFYPCFLSAEEANEFLWGDEGQESGFAKKYVRPFLNGDEEYVITTNIDNDDAFHQDAIRTLQQQFCQTPQVGIYSLIWGLQYFPQWNALLKMRYPHNHFLTLAETVNDCIHTIEYYPHTIARKKFRTVDIVGLPAWIEVVHSCNVNNELRITSRIRYVFILKRTSLQAFGLSVVIPAGRHVVNVMRLSAYFFKVAVWRLIRKWKKK